MKIFRKKISPIAEEIVNTLSRDEDIEILGSLHGTVVKDISQFLEGYVRAEQSLTEEARVVLDEQALPFNQINKVKALLAKERNFKLGDEAMEVLADKIIRYFFTEDSIDEVFSEDVTMRKKIFDIFRKHLEVEDDIDREVRARIKNIPETSRIFRIEYEKVLREVKRKRGLDS